uniref:MICOS complex subunit MIC13 n=1 Tax=Ascaris lumbricoides TaxID=6252 RepID=A0A0M3HQM2_ASCLU
MGVFWQLVRVGVKVGVVAGAVKLSVDQDIWSLNTNKGARVYANLQEHVVPGTIVFPEKLPSREEVRRSVGGAWNCGVDAFFTGLEKMPSFICYAIMGDNSAR